MIALVATLTLLMLAIGVLLAATPSLMPPTECFAVTVPPSAQDDPRIRTLKRRYVTGVLIATAVATVGPIVFVALVGLRISSETTLVTLVETVPIFLLLVVSTALMLHCRAQVREIKRTMGWGASGSRAATVVGTEAVSRPLSLLWNLLYLPLIVALIAASLLLYAHLPEQMPMQINLGGEVVRSVPKSHAVALFPAAVVSFLALMMTLAHWSILRSKRPIDPASPSTSALAYGIFARTTSIVLLAGGLTISAAVGITYFLSALGAITLETAAAVIGIASMGFVIAMIWVSVTFGQSGARLAKELRASDEIARDDDACWPLGMFYFNQQDPSIMVPKRFGIGWTMNMGRPATWALIALIVALSVAFVIATEMMVG